MRALNVGLISAVMLSASGCAFVQAVASGDRQGAFHEAGKITMSLAEGKLEGDRRSKQICGPMENQIVPLDEERAIGGAIAVGLTDHYRAHFYIDGNPEKKDPTALATAAKNGQVSLPDSERNNLNAYLSVVGRNLASYSPRPEIVWTFGVLNSPTVNAFSAPGGYVYVTTALLKLIDNEAQLAAVLAHEIGHISGRHAMKGYTKVKFEQCDNAVKGGALIEGGLDAAPELRAAAAWAKFFSGGKFDLDDPNMAASLVAKLTDGYIEDQINKGLAAPDELEADRYAIELTAFAGYDTGEYERLLQKLGAPSKDDHHPPLADRLAAIKKTRADVADFAARGVKPDNSAALKVVKK